LEQKKVGLALGIGWSPDALVCGTIEDEPQRPRNFTKAITRLAGAAA
jgi:hypothetical protein